MQIGLSIASSHQDKSDRDTVRAVIERARVAADAGLDHLSLGDHHSTGQYAPYVQNVPMLREGRFAQVCPAGRIATIR